MKLKREKIFLVLLATLSPVSFFVGYQIESEFQFEQPGYSLSFIDHEISCFDENLIVYLYLENLGYTQFTQSDIDEDEWQI